MWGGADDILDAVDDDGLTPAFSDDNDVFDPFARDESTVSNPQAAGSPKAQALNHIRDILNLPPLSLNDDDEDKSHGHSEEELSASASTYPQLRTPIFLGHGSDDPEVSVRLGERMTFLLSEKPHMDVTWKAYEGFGHWYKVPDETDDMVAFLKAKEDLSTTDE
ncbi:hypothetical protein VTN00DRAFT_6112 [Thermoascus crustaceus]|uniref:uncharacterized protein n=1 Tax=Thermoascus crustaceus TaxID=5088 RepID=UPI003742A794